LLSKNAIIKNTILNESWYSEIGTALSLSLVSNPAKPNALKANHFTFLRFESFAMNKNAVEAKMESILLMIAIDFHEQARREVGRLAGARTKLKAAGVECRLIDRRLAAAKETELQLRDELLRFPVMTTQDAATKAAHLRQALKQDETTSEAGERYL